MCGCCFLGCCSFVFYPPITSFRFVIFHYIVTSVDSEDNSTITTFYTMAGDDTYPTQCEGHHHNEGLSPTVLIAMCVGTPHEISLDVEPFASYARKSTLRLSRSAMNAEARRRLREHDASEEGKPNSHTTLSGYLSYLRDNPITEPMEVTYLQTAMARFTEDITRLNESANSNSSASSPSTTWRGLEPNLRLYHVCVELRDKL